MGRGWRHADDWLSYDLAVDPQKPTTLSCVYWGSDVGRKFDLEADGKVIATQELEMPKPSMFFRVDYPIPAELTKGKDKVTITFRKVSGLVGGVFRCSTRLANR
jgi:Cu/Ag efflux protein CusF